MAFKRFLRHQFFGKKGISYFLFSVLFIFFLISIVNFTTTYLHCRRDMLRIEDAYLKTAKGCDVVPDTVSIVAKDTVITKIVVWDTFKNDSCCHCTQSSLSNCTFDLKTLEDVHKVFDDNLLTFLISFALIAVLTMVIHDSEDMYKMKSETEVRLEKLNNLKSDNEDQLEKLNKLKSDNEDQLQSLSGTIESERKKVEKQLAEMQGLKIELDAKINDLNYVYESSLFNYECQTLVANIETSDYTVNDTLYAAIESLHIKIDDFNREITPYSDNLKEEAVFSSDTISRITAPLLEAKNKFDDLYRLAKRYESKLIKRKPDLVSDLRSQTSPLLNSIDLLVKKIEGYSSAPKNQQMA